MPGVRPKTFVLVPGAWVGGWSWYPVARLLRERGHGVLTLTLPGLSYGSSPAGLRITDAVDSSSTRSRRAICRTSSWSATAGATTPRPARPAGWFPASTKSSTTARWYPNGARRCPMRTSS